MAERMRDQHDPDLETIAELQRSITATLTYLMGRASLAELFGLQAYLSQLASRMTPPDAGNPRLPQSWIDEFPLAPTSPFTGKAQESSGQNQLKDTSLMHEFQNQLRGQL